MTRHYLEENEGDIGIDPISSKLAISRKRPRLDYEDGSQEKDKADTNLVIFILPGF